MDPTPIRDIARFWHDPELGNLELLRATYITHVFPPHAHEGFAIGIIERGAQAFTYGRSQHLILPAGTVCAVNPGEVHSGKAAREEGWTYRMIYPDGAMLQRAASQIAGQERGVPFFRTPLIRDDDLLAVIRGLHRTLEDPATSLIERESRLLWGLGLLIARHAEDRPGIGAIQKGRREVRIAREYLDACYAENVSLDSLAALVDLSPFHLLRLFRNEIGFAPHTYLTQIRVSCAKRLLLTGAPIAEVARQTGFADQSHLTRHFKRIVGVTPQQFREHRFIFSD